MSPSSFLEQWNSVSARKKIAKLREAMAAAMGVPSNTIQSGTVIGCEYLESVTPLLALLSRRSLKIDSETTFGGLIQQLGLAK